MLRLLGRFELGYAMLIAWPAVAGCLAAGLYDWGAYEG